MMWRYVTIIVLVLGLSSRNVILIGVAPLCVLRRGGQEVEETYWKLLLIFQLELSMKMISGPIMMLQCKAKLSVITATRKNSVPSSIVS